MAGITTSSPPPSIGGGLSGVTTGSVLFGGAAVFAQDNTNLFWDDSANVLSVSGLIPASDDGAALGNAATRRFSDLFLAEGGVINWDNGDATLTQAGNVVTLGGAAFLNTNYIEFADSDFNTYVGNLAGRANGLAAGTLRNSFFGYNAGSSTTSDADDNTGIGYGVMVVNTTGNLNTGVGSNALISNTTGIENTGLGKGALRANTTGNQNVGVGNTALDANTTGIRNVAVGVSALADVLITNNTDGLNTALGYNTGRGITTGKNNTILGANVTGLGATLSNNVIIADGDGNRRINVSSTGLVGINTTGPENQLDVNSSTGACLQLTYNDADGSAANKVNFAVSSSGDLNVTPSGGDMTVTGNLVVTGSITTEACRVYNSADQSVNNTTDTVLTFDSERHDSATLHSTVSNTGRITFPTAGFRMFGACVEFAANNTGNRRQLYVRLNGSTVIAFHYQTPVQGSIPTTMTICAGYYFAANDYIEVLAYQDSGGALNINGLTAANYGSEFWSYRAA